ncbi:MAG: ABC transporter transmembrane domain-containing protein, partial [Patescibacteria group bacterium]
MLNKETSTIGKVFSLLGRIGINPRYLAVPVVLAILAAAFEGFGMGMLIPLLQGFLQKNVSFIHDLPVLGRLSGALPAGIVGNDRLLFGILAGGFIVLFILRNLFKFLTAASVGYFSTRALHHLRKTLFSKYLGFGKLFFDRTTLGHHSVLLMEFSQQALYPLQAVDALFGSLFSLAVYLTVMFFISWKLTLAALPLFILLHYAIRTMITRIKASSYALAERGNALGKKSVEILSTIPLVKSTRMERQEQQHYTEISDAKAALDFRIRLLQSMILPLQEIITILVAAAVFAGTILWFGREQIASAPALIVYFYIIINASGKFGNLSGFRGALATANAPLREVLRIFDDEGK